MPKVSVIIPAYNYARYLPLAVQSALNQKGVEPEILVIDDGSTDNTPEVAAGFGSNILYIRKENQGLSAARNTGMEAASGDFMVFLDADDLLGENCLASHLDVFRSNPEADLSVCRNQMFRAVTPHSQLVPVDLWFLCKSDPLLHLCFLNIAPPHAFMIKSAAARRTGFFDTTLKACEDYDFWLRCAALGQKIAVNPAGMVFYRRHPGSISDQLDTQLEHDVVMHKRLAALLKSRPDFVGDRREEAYLAHAAGCLFSAARSAGRKCGYAPELYALCNASVKNMFTSRDMNSENGMRRQDTRDLREHFIYSIFNSLNLLKKESHPELYAVRKVFKSLYSEYGKKLTVAVHWESLQKTVVCQNVMDRIEFLPAPDPQANVSRKKVLLADDVCRSRPDVQPSCLEKLGVSLVDAGYEVHFVCTRAQGFEAVTRRGMHPVPFRCRGVFADEDKGEEYESYKAFLFHAEYDAAFFAGNHDSWITAPLAEKPLPHMRAYVMPRMKPEDAGGPRNAEQIAIAAVIVLNATGCIARTRSSFSARFAETLGKKPIILPWIFDPEDETPLSHGVNEKKTEDIALVSAEGAAHEKILHAMKNGIPWLAAQEYDGISDYAGGLACAPDALEAALQTLRDNAPLRHALGDLGREHRARLSRQAVMSAVAELIEKGEITPDWFMPQGLHAANETLKRKILPFETADTITISIIISTYNAEKYLEIALRSIETQTYPHWEIIVQDGGSTDGTLNILKRHPHSVDCISAPDSGIYDAWNKAVARAGGDWIIFLGADDFLLHDKVLENSVACLKQFSEEIIYAYGVVLQGEKGQVNYVFNNSLHNTFHIFFSDMGIQFPGTFIRSSFLKKHAFDTSYKIAGDFELAARTVSLGNVSRIPLAVAYREMGGMSTNPDHAGTLMRERKEILWRCVAPRAHEFMEAAIATVDSQDHEYA